VTSIMYTPTPEEKARQAQFAKWQSSGSPGYKPTSQALSWDQLNRLPAARQKGADGSIGAGLSSTPEYQRWAQTENTNADAQRKAFEAWSGGAAIAKPGQAQPSQNPYDTATPYGAWAPAPGSQPVAGPVQGTTMYRPPINSSPPPPPSRPAIGGGRQPATRSPAPRQPGVDGGPMPVGAPPALMPFFEQAQQMFPGANKFQQYEIANRLKTQQWQQQQQGIQDMRNQANQQWVAQQRGPAQQFPGMPTGSGAGLFQPSPTGPFRDNSFNGVTNRPVGGYGQPANFVDMGRIVG
jgi:hypothetical protein